MAVAKETRTTNIAPWLGASVLSASLLKPVFERVANMRATRGPKRGKAAKQTSPALTPQTLPALPVQTLLARIEEQITLTPAQIEKIANAVSERVSDLSGQVQEMASKIHVTRPAKWGRRAWWTMGISLGFLAAGSTAFVFIRRRMQHQLDAELVPLPTSNGQQGRVARVVNSIMHRDHSSKPNLNVSHINGNGSDLVRTAPYVGNVRTRVYHPVDSEHLPIEENRIYFRSEDEASEAGYHRAEID